MFTYPAHDGLQQGVRPSIARDYGDAVRELVGIIGRFCNRAPARAPKSSKALPRHTWCAPLG